MSYLNSENVLLILDTDLRLQEAVTRWLSFEGWRIVFNVDANCHNSPAFHKYVERTHRCRLYDHESHSFCESGFRTSQMAYIYANPNILKQSPEYFFDYQNLLQNILKDMHVNFNADLFNLTVVINDPKRIDDFQSVLKVVLTTQRLRLAHVLFFSFENATPQLQSAVEEIDPTSNWDLSFEGDPNFPEILRKMYNRMNSRVRFSLGQEQEEFRLLDPYLQSLCPGRFDPDQTAQLTIDLFNFFCGKPASMRLLQ